MRNAFLFASFLLVVSSCFAQHTMQFQLKAAEDIDIKKCRGYISGVTVNYNDGTSWTEENSYHLLDFLNDESASISLETDAEKTITSIEYCMGTDSIINTSGAYEGDLDPIHGMYWAWNSGYINFKLEAEYNGENYSYHIGGYAAPYPTLRTKKHMINQDSDTTIITIDIDAILRSNIAQSDQRMMSPGADSAALSTIIANATEQNE